MLKFQPSVELLRSGRTPQPCEHRVAPEMQGAIGLLHPEQYTLPKGSRGLVTRDIVKVTIFVIAYNPN